MGWAGSLGVSVDPVGFTVCGPSSVSNAHMCRELNTKVQGLLESY